MTRQRLLELAHTIPEHLTEPVVLMLEAVNMLVARVEQKACGCVQVEKSALEELCRVAEATVGVALHHDRGHEGSAEKCSDPGCRQVYAAVRAVEASYNGPRDSR